MRWLAPPAIGALALVSGATVAVAGPLTAGSVVRVPDDPLGGPDAEVEPHVAMDPTNPMHLVGSVQQDRWIDCSSPASWAAGGETRLSTSGSFDYTTAPNANGLFLGDYDGLASAGTTFKAFFAMSKPVATAGATDLFSNSAT